MRKIFAFFAGASAGILLFILVFYFALIQLFPEILAAYVLAVTIGIFTASLIAPSFALGKLFASQAVIAFIYSIAGGVLSLLFASITSVGWALYLVAVMLIAGCAFIHSRASIPQNVESRAP